MYPNRDVGFNYLNWTKVAEESVLGQISVSAVLNPRFLLDIYSAVKECEDV